jgi:ssRNA-specific RNase YbeY (16S rRNA maturation enzyme)
LLGYDDQTPEGKETMTRMEDHYLSKPIVPDQI